jgi:hypothetical protein
VTHTRCLLGGHRLPSSPQSPPPPPPGLHVAARELKALRISERWCDCGMDKRSICQPRQARDKEFYNWSMTIPYPSGLKMRCAHFFGCVVFILNTTMRRCAVRARAQPLPLYLSTILYTRVRPASFLSRSLSLLARTSAYLLCESSSPRVLSERGCFVPATGRCITYNKLREYTHTHQGYHASSGRFGALTGHFERNYKYISGGFRL